MELHTKLNIEQAKLEISDVKFTPLERNSILCTITHQCGHIFTGASSCFTLNGFNLQIGCDTAYKYAFDEYVAAYAFLQRVKEFETNGTTSLVNDNIEVDTFWYSELTRVMQDRYTNNDWDQFEFLPPYAYFGIMDVLNQLRFVPLGTELWDTNFETMKTMYIGEAYNVVWFEIERIVTKLKEIEA